MIMFLAGVNCVGKTTVGPLLAMELECGFFDLDRSMEAFYGVSLSQLGKIFFPEPEQFRCAMAEVLTELVLDYNDLVIALNPPALMDPVWDVIKKITDRIVVVMEDEPENIADRAIWYDDNNKLIPIRRSPYLKKLWIEEVNNTIEYLKPSFERADIKVNIAGCSSMKAMKKVLHETHYLRAKLRGVVSGETGKTHRFSA
jgi:shikimate kinase